MQEDRGRGPQSGGDMGDERIFKHSALLRFVSQVLHSACECQHPAGSVFAGDPIGECINLRTGS